MFRGFAIKDPKSTKVDKQVTFGEQPGGSMKRKLAPDYDQSTLDKLADLDLDSDEEELKLTMDPKDEEDLLSLCDDMDIVPGRGVGRGRGRDRFGFGKGSLPNFREYRDYLKTTMMENLVPEVRALSTCFEDDAEEDDVQKDMTNEGEAEGDVVPGVQGTETGLMCQMKWMRTVGLDNSGKIKCCVSNSVAGSETGKTESVQADTIRNLTNVYMKKRGEIVDSNGVVPTPVHIVKKLALENSETLHYEITRFCSGRHRVEMFSGSLRGLGEGVTKRIAAQMACIDLLERIQLSGGAVKVPTVAFLPGWLTSNRIFRDLNALCTSRELPRIRIVAGPNVTDEGGYFDPKKPPYRAECWVGEDLVTVAESEAEIFAKREAAKQMYHLISNEEYKDTPYAIGQACQSAAELAGAGHKQIMSDYKKVWLLQHRVEDKQLMIPEEELGFDDPIDVEELEKDMETLAESVSYKLMKKNTIKVTVNNKKKRMTLDDVEEDEEEGANCTLKRSVSVEAKDVAGADDGW